MLYVAAIGGGIVIKNSMDKTAAAVASANELRAQIDAAEEKRVALEAQYNAAVAAGVDTKALRDEIAAGKPIAALSKERNERASGQAAAGGGGAPAAKPAGGGGGASKPCNCTPGDPLCSCL